MSIVSSNGTETQQLLPFMEKLWMSFAQSVEARDKFLRTVFFGTKMVDSYFENQLSDENKERLSLVMSTASQARKAFRYKFSNITQTQLLHRDVNLCDLIQSKAV